MPRPLVIAFVGDADYSKFAADHINAAYDPEQTDRTERNEEAAAALAAMGISVRAIHGLSPDRLRDPSAPHNVEDAELFEIFIDSGNGNDPYAARPGEMPLDGPDYTIQGLWHEAPECRDDALLDELREVMGDLATAAQLTSQQI